MKEDERDKGKEERKRKEEIKGIKENEITTCKQTQPYTLSIKKAKTRDYIL